MNTSKFWKKSISYALLLCIILCDCGLIYFLFRISCIKSAQSSELNITTYEITEYGELPIIRYVLTTDEGKYLMDEFNSILCGPYADFYDEDLDTYAQKIYRYVGENGLIGYVSIDGEEITPAVYERATQMRYRSALVKEQGVEGIYYISNEGERFTYEFYSDGYPFAESQGSYARVQAEDGTWAVIDRSESVLVEGMDYINELPLIYTFFTGVKDGQAYIYDLPIFTEDDMFTVYLPEFCDISEIYYGLFAIVQNEEGLYGVVTAVGKEILPAEYYSLSFEVMPSSEEYEPFTTFKFTLQTSADSEYEEILISDWW